MDAASHSSAGSGNGSGQGSNTANSHTHTTRVGKLLPKNLGVRSRWRKQSKESFGSINSDEDHRGRGLSRENGNDNSIVSLSDTTTQPHHEGDDEAVFENVAHDPGSTYEGGGKSDRNSSSSRSPSRPAIPSTHPSHIGQLTTSSPIIQSEHIPEIQSTDQTSLDSVSRSRTFTTSSAASNDPNRKSATGTVGLDVPRSQPLSRSRSPASRIREAFRSKKSTSPAPEARSETGVAEERPVTGTSKTGSDADDTKLVTPERSYRPKSQVKIDTSVRPQTPPSSGSARPLIVSTPPTPTDTSPTKEQRDSPRRSSPGPVGSNPNVVISPSGHMITHRRARSGSALSIGPSKLSNATLPPLTPTPENPSAPSTPGAGFFSNVLSAAQNAASTLSSTISSTNPGSGGPKPKNTPSEQRPESDDKVQVEPTVEPAAPANMGDRELAVKTIGSGDLSLSQLGLPESDASTPVAPRDPATTGSRSRSESAPGDPPRLITNGDTSDKLDPAQSKPALEHSATSPPTSVYEGKSNASASGSIRNGLGRRRKRGSTTDTKDTTTSSTLGLSTVTLNVPTAQPSAAPKLTGFAVASKKRNRDFHTFFKSVPDDDYLIEDYSCALQREILAHGRLYVSEGHLCFSSNIFGWVTTLVMSFDEIISVEKRSTALVFKNGLMISTLHAKHVFASFTSRDSTYDLIINIWKLGHPTLRSSLNGISLDEVGGDKTEKVFDNEDATRSRSVLPSDEDDEDEGSEDGDIIYDEDEDDEDVPDIAPPADAGLTEAENEKAISRKASGLNGAVNGTDRADASPTAAGAADFPGPATHAPTECGDADTHYDVSIGDDVIPAPLGKVYDYIFGPTSGTFMSKWLTGEQKCFDLQMEDKKGLTQDNKSRSYTYIKPLNGPIGPKQTKCIVTESIENMDLEKSVNVSVITQTPDVPSGNVFSVKTKYCLSWAENNATRVTANCAIEWTGKSWIKGPIEKGAKDGQTQYCKDLFASLKSAVSSRPRAAGPGGAKGKKKKAKGKQEEPSKASNESSGGSPPSKTEDWGVFEPLRCILGPVVDILKPVLGGNLLYGLLFGLLLSSWFGIGFNNRPAGHGYNPDVAFRGRPERAVAYEEMWRREESELWDWLEERVGLHRMSQDAPPPPFIRRRVMEPRVVERKVREDRMSEREVEEAIRVTEEKLQLLKAVVDRKNNVVVNDDDDSNHNSKRSGPTTRAETMEA